MKEPRTPTNGNGNTWQPGMAPETDYRGDALGEPALSTSSSGGGSITGLLRQLTHEVTSLFTKEVALAKAEASESLHAAKAGVGAIASGGAVLLSGFIVFLFAIVYGLSYIMAAWLASLLVGVVVMAIGFGMVKAGQKKLDARSLRPDRTIETMQRDRDAVRDATTRRSVQ